MKNAFGDDNIPVDLLKELGDIELKIMTSLVNNIYISGDWPGFPRCYTDYITKEKPSKEIDRKSVV